MRSGTPLYQAPEQLAGREVTTRSDIFALGLMLYEVFTGKRAFPSSNRDTPPSKPSSHITNLNPVVETVILRCLEPDPAKRPQSAMEVLAGLPGGDPLAAALAAGQTPSPQLVADAGGAGLIRPWVGAATFAGVLLALAAFAAMYPQTMLFSRAGGLPKSTQEWLSGKARGMLELAGVPDGHTAVGYDHDLELMKWVKTTDHAPNRWDRLARPPAAAITFWHRESPEPLVPGLFYPYPGSVETTRITWYDPAPIVPGMSGVRLAPDGRLMEFYSVPWEFARPADRSLEWTAWFEKAYLKLADFHAADDRSWVPPVFAEAVFAWVPNEPVDPDQPVRVEAGTHRGRVVWFRVVQRWHVPGENDPTRRAGCRGRRSTRDWRSRLREFAVVPVRPARGRGTRAGPGHLAQRTG